MPIRFSARWEDGTPGLNPLAEAVAARRASGLPLLDLTVSNPTQVGIRFPDDWMQAMGVPSLSTYAADPKGLLPAREVIAGYYNQRDRDRGEPVDADDLFLTSGTSEGYAHLFRLLCDPGDAMLVPTPSYPLLETLAGLADVSLGAYPLIPVESDGSFVWKLDRDTLSESVTPATKAVCVVQPNNPTGSVLSEDDAAWLLDFAARHGLALIVDEVFADYRFDEGFDDGRDGGATLRLTSNGPLVFTLNGLSKLVGLPQLKLAWIHVAGNAADRARAKEHLEWICDAYLSVGAAPQLAVPELLRRRAEFQEPIQARLRENLATLRAVATTNPRLNPLWPQGGWCVPIRCAGVENDEAFAIRLVKEAGVQLQPGYFFGFDDEETVVASLLTPPDEFRQGLERVAAALA